VTKGPFGKKALDRLWARERSRVATGTGKIEWHNEIAKQSLRS
jgi:hypothetical protein